jgi:serine/threonine protein kinase
MDVVHRTEAWAPSGDSFEYSHTTIIFKNSATGQYSHASTVRRYRPNDNVDIRELTLHAIPIADLFPSLQQLDAFTRAPNPPSANTYIKRPQLFAYPEISGRYRISDLVLHEARMCEIVRQNPHPNIAKYLGVFVEGERIMGLSFMKYESTLGDRLGIGPKISDPEHVLRGIEHGIRHLHGLGPVHNDINPYNIMLTSDEIAIIIDFDSCQFLGSPLGAKVGTEGWARRSVAMAETENDFYGLEKIAELMGIRL